MVVYFPLIDRFFESKGNQMKKATLILFLACVFVTSNYIAVADWKDQYIVDLKPTHNLGDFKLNWFKPVRAEMLAEKPDNITLLPDFHYDTQKFIAIYLGDANENSFVGVIDFRSQDKTTHPAFDLYLDVDGDGDFAEDFVVDKRKIEIQIPYEDAPPQKHHIHVYSSQNNGVILILYQCRTGRYGLIDNGDTKIPVLIIDGHPNGIFDDSDDYILLDWDLDGQLDASHQTEGYLPLFSDLKLPDATFVVTDIDPAGTQLTIQKIE